MTVLSLARNKYFQFSDKTVLVKFKLFTTLSTVIVLACYKLFACRLPIHQFRIEFYFLLAEGPGVARERKSFEKNIFDFF